ncbi:MAG: NAD-dependent epimerase/dehydratase family protein, partial [Pseudomonadota bacterium]
MLTSASMATLYAGVGLAVRTVHVLIRSEDRPVPSVSNNEVFAMHILLTGGTGFIGQALVPALRDENHEVSVLSRSRNEESTGLRYITALDALPSPVDAVINLAGASLAAKRWNASYKTAIRNSRLRTTSALGRYFAKRDEVPGVWLNGSAIGFY